MLDLVYTLDSFLITEDDWAMEGLKDIGSKLMKVITFIPRMIMKFISWLKEKISGLIKGKKKIESDSGDNEDNESGAGESEPVDNAELRQAAVNQAKVVKSAEAKINRQEAVNDTRYSEVKSARNNAAQNLNNRHAQAANVMRDSYKNIMQNLDDIPTNNFDNSDKSMSRDINKVQDDISSELDDLLGDNVVVDNTGRIIDELDELNKIIRESRSAKSQVNKKYTIKK